MLTYWETLIARKSNITVSDSYAALWGKKSQSGYTVETYTGALPATLQTVEGYLERYKIYGNTVQDGTPTPESPIMPSGCGERTGNLFNISQVVTNMQVIKQGSSLKVMAPSTTTGVSAAAPNTLQDYCPTLNVNDEVTLSFETTGSLNFIYLSGENIVWGNGQSKTMTATMLSSVVIWYASGRDTEAVISNFMLNLGSTALPYEPYGYKLPLTSAGQDVDIYLGESQTTRRIKKLVLTGTDADGIWVASTARAGSFYTSIGVNGIIGAALCDRAVNAKTLADYNYGNIYVEKSGISVIINLWLFNAAITLTDFRSYLAAQYANGTPVTIWYVLAEPETGIVNEPLMKIGDYADTVSMEQAGVSIPTAASETTISWAGEGLAPSEVEFVYKVKR